MQLNKLSSLASFLILSLNASAQDYVNVQLLHYNEGDARVSVLAPSLEINKDFGTDYTLNLDIVTDSVSGASPTYYDAISGASAYSRGNSSTIKKGNIDFKEQRNAGSANLTTRFDNRDELQTGISFSGEHDFYSGELSASYLHYLDPSHNQSVIIGGSYQNNQILVKCDDHSECDASSGASQKMTNNMVTLQIGFSQILDPESLVNIGAFYTAESGFLSSPYHNVVRNTTQVTNELKPDSRNGYGIKIGYQESLSERVSTHLNYRFYNDDWKITSHTLDTLIYYEFDKSLTLNGGIRYYTQTKADFYGEMFSNERFASSDERMNAFNALTYKVGASYKINDKLEYNMNANFYRQSSGLDATYFITGIKYLF